MIDYNFGVSVQNTYEIKKLIQIILNKTDLQIVKS